MDNAFLSGDLYVRVIIIIEYPWYVVKKRSYNKRMTSIEKCKMLQVIKPQFLSARSVARKFIVSMLYATFLDTSGCEQYINKNFERESPREA